MKQKILAICLGFFLAIPMMYAQNTELPDVRTTINGYYKLALQYKNGTGVPIDFEKAYHYFSQAAVLGDAQSIYAIGYMQYKGLGCTQDYTSAANLFAKGAFQGRDNSMYFYGLCWRNGYGVVKNEDSAKYYLNKALALNYKQAALELQSIAAENSNDSAATALVQQLHNAAMPNKTVFNQFTKITPHMPSTEVFAGYYTGWLLQYDWGGTHIVSSKKLQLTITHDNARFSGQWIEDGADTAIIKAKLLADSLLFSDTKYKRKDHYSIDSGVLYQFTNAKLNLVQVGDSVFIAGTVEMFSPQRGEPSKPLFVALARAKVEDTSIKLKIKAYPNPFSSFITVEFELPQKEYTEVQVLRLSGEIIYENTAGILEQGNYSLPLKIGNAAAGTYIIKIIYGKQITNFKVVKEN